MKRKNNLSFIFGTLERFWTMRHWMFGTKRLMVVVVWATKKETPDPPADPWRPLSDDFAVETTKGIYQ